MTSGRGRGGGLTTVTTTEDANLDTGAAMGMSGGNIDHRETTIGNEGEESRAMNMTSNRAESWSVRSAIVTANDGAITIANAGTIAIATETSDPAGGSDHAAGRDTGVHLQGLGRAQGPPRLNLALTTSLRDTGAGHVRRRYQHKIETHLRAEKWARAGIKTPTIGHLHRHLILMTSTT